ncbi:MAG: hypothetical protein ABIW76_00770 [Fibrobacteria bacterium]
MQITARIFLGLFLLAPGTHPAAAGSPDRWTQYANTGEITVMADAGDQVWLGTLGGLIRIEKVAGETTYFNQANSSLSDLRIQSLASDGNGTIAAVTQHGALSVFNGRSWTRPGTEAPLLGQFSFDALWDSAGSFWVLAADRQTGFPSVFRKRNSQWIRFFLDSVDRMSPNGYGDYSYSGYYYGGLGQPRLQTDRKGTLWASVLNRGKPKVFRFDPDGSIDSVPAPQGNGVSGYGGPNIQFIVPDSGTPVWLENRVMLQAAPGGDTIRLPQIFNTNSFLHPRNRCARASDGSQLWSFVPGKIHRLRSGVWDTLPPLDGNSSRPPLLLQAVARKGPTLQPYTYVSAGTAFGMLEVDSWKAITMAKTPIRARGSFTLFSGGSGDFKMLVRDSWGVDGYDSRAGLLNTFYSFPITSPDRFTALFTDRSGRVWASGRGILGLLRQGEFKLLKSADGSWLGPDVYSYSANAFMAEGRDGTLWFADSSRLFSSRGGSEDTGAWIGHPLPAPWVGRVRISALGRHADGSIWIAANRSDFSGGGIAARYDGKTWRVHDSLLTAGFAGQTIWDLRCDGAGNVWLRYREGLLQWNGTAWKKHPWSSSPLLGKGIEALAMDGSGTLWATTSLPDATILKWEEGWKSIPDATGKMGSSPIRSIAFDNEGKLWMAPDQGGILVFDPQGATVSAKTPSRMDAQVRSKVVSGRSVGSWRIVLPQSPAGGSGTRILDIQGRAIPLRDGH